MKKLLRKKPRTSRPGMEMRRARKRVCKFCASKMHEIDYKDGGFLRNFISDRAKIMPRRISGTCAKHQRRLAVAIKRARFMGILPTQIN